MNTETRAGGPCYSQFDVGHAVHDDLGYCGRQSLDYVVFTVPPCEHKPTCATFPEDVGHGTESREAGGARSRHKVLPNGPRRIATEGFRAAGIDLIRGRVDVSAHRSAPEICVHCRIVVALATIGHR